MGWDNPPTYILPASVKLRRLIVKLSLLFLCAFCLSAGASPPANLQFVRLMNDQGISVGSVEVIFQDHLGYMWIGGADGLVQYDGYNFITYRNKPNDNTSLSSNIIWDIHEDKKGNLWIATDLGINLFNRDLGNFTYYLHNPQDANSLIGNSTRSIAEDAAGNLWIATIEGLSKFDTQQSRFTNFIYSPNDPNSLSSKELRKIIVDRNGTTLWIGQYARGLNRLDTLSGEVKRYSYGVSDGKGVSHSNLISLFQDRDGFIWLGTDGGGLNRLNPSTDEFIYFPANPADPQALSNPSVTGITGDEQGNLWIATEGGLNHLDRQTMKFTHYVNNPNQKYSLGSSNVHSIFVDSNHDLWVGNFPTGVNFLDVSNMVFRTYRSDPNNTNSLSNGSVLSMDEFPEGVLWLGTDGGGLNRFDMASETFTRYPPEPNNPQAMKGRAILSVRHLADGTLWMGSWHGGLNHFDPKHGAIKHYPIDPRPGGLTNDNVWALNVDSQQNLWVGSIGGGVDFLANGSDTFKNYQKQFPGGTTTFSVTWKIFQDHKGEIWIGTNDGLGHYIPNEDHFYFYRHDEKDPSTISFDVVLDITEDSQQQLWIATRGGGLNLFDRKTGKFTAYREKDGLPDDVVRSIKADNLGNLWLGSASGLTQFNPTTKKIVNYNEKNGLQGNLFNFATALKTNAGEMVFGGTGGFTIFDPAKLTSNTFVPPVVIEDFQIFNKPVIVGAPDSPLAKVISQTDSITLDYHQTVFSFSFAAMSYRNAEKNRFAYIMEGFEKDWNYVGSDRRVATYTNLNPGTYVFKVRAANNEGVWNDTGRSITVRILPPPWKTWWAYIVYIMIFASILYSFALTQRRKVLNEQKINKRLQQLDKLKDEFLANTSHELRTPLNGIIGLAESLRDGVGGAQSEISKTNLDMIVSSGKRLERLVNAILDFSKLKEHSLTLYPKPLDLHAMTDVVLALSQPSLAGKDLKLVNAINSDVPLVDADEDRVQQILHNLVGNAIKFTNKGTVTVSASIVKGMLKICVSDTGIGIEPEEINYIFDSFHQVEGNNERQYSGTGLGLTVTKQLVELHGGEISVESTPGTGSSFYFTLPLSLATDNRKSAPKQHSSYLHVAEHAFVPSNEIAERVTPLASASESPKEHSQFHILIVDDEPINRQVLMNHLSLQEYRVSCASSGREALDLLDSQSVDLMVLDIMMPNMSGYDVCKQVRARFSSHELPIIFLTAKTQINDLVTGFALGANDFLTKPINRDELLARVNTHLQLLEITRNLEKKVSERTEELQQKHKLLEDAYLQLEKISLSDPLTGLSNRRYLQKLIPMDVAKVQREYNDKLNQRSPKKVSLDLAFFLLDVDNFKWVNDIYGHMIGDQLLIQFSNLLTRVCRETDCLVRWGGEEFLIVSRFTDRDEAPLMAERIRKAIAQHKFELGEGVVLQKTCSIGFACYPFLPGTPHALSWEQVIDTADQALYAAKKSGRNRSVGLMANPEIEIVDLHKRISTDIKGLITSGELIVVASNTDDLVWD